MKPWEFPTYMLYFEQFGSTLLLHSSQGTYVINWSIYQLIINYNTQNTGSGLEGIFGVVVYEKIILKTEKLFRDLKNHKIKLETWGLTSLE